MIKFHSTLIYRKQIRATMFSKIKAITPYGACIPRDAKIFV